MPVTISGRSVGSMMMFWRWLICSCEEVAEEDEEDEDGRQERAGSRKSSRM